MNQDWSNTHNLQAVHLLHPHLVVHLRVQARVRIVQGVGIKKIRNRAGGAEKIEARAVARVGAVARRVQARVEVLENQ